MPSLIEMQSRVYALPALQSKRQALAAEVANAAQDAQTLLEQYEKEHNDVEILQKDSVLNDMRRAAGRYERRAEKEWAEEAAAKAAYTHAAARQAQLERALAQLDSEIQEAQTQAAQYDTALRARRAALQEQPGSAAYQQLAALEAGHQTMAAQAGSVWQAAASAQNIYHNADMTLKPLLRAQEYMRYYINLGDTEWYRVNGYIYYANKEANQLLGALCVQLQSFFYELQRLYWAFPPVGASTYSLGQFIAYWLGSPIQEGTLAARAQIVWQLQCHLLSFSTALDAAYRQLQASLQANRMQQEALLIGAE